MQGIVLAAGEGTRLPPLTADRLKGLVPVGDRPLLSHVFEMMVDLGVAELLAVGVVEKPVEPPLRWIPRGFFALDERVVQTCRHVNPGHTGDRDPSDALDRLLSVGLSVETVELDGWCANVNEPVVVERAEARFGFDPWVERFSRSGVAELLCGSKMVYSLLIFFESLRDPLQGNYQPPD